MAEPSRPAPNKAYGRQNWLVIPTTAGYATGVGPSVAEVTGASALDVTNIVFADASINPGQSTNTATQQRRLGDTRTYNFSGTTTYSGGDFTYEFDPQAATATAGVALWEKISAGGLFFLVRRLGVPRATAPAAGQFVDVYPADIGPSMPTTSGDAESAETAAMAHFEVYNVPLFKVAITA
jgi:hypothetical protein